MHPANDRLLSAPRTRNILRCRFLSPDPFAAVESEVTRNIMVQKRLSQRARVIIDTLPTVKIKVCQQLGVLWAGIYSRLGLTLFENGSLLHVKVDRQSLHSM
jgi:hypothetical protein